MCIPTLGQSADVIAIRFSPSGHLSDKPAPDASPPTTTSLTRPQAVCHRPPRSQRRSTLRPRCAPGSQRSGDSSSQPPPCAFLCATASATMEVAGDTKMATTGAAAPLSPAPHDQPKPTTETVPDTGAKPASALTPPASEELNHETKEEESELSDLDLSDDDEEEIEPDHYWDGGNIPVFKPTMAQFKSFKKFIEKVDKYGMKSGIVKVIPPDEWRNNLPALDEKIKRIRIKNPITQEFNGTLGTYTQQNVEKQRSYNLPEWKALTHETQHQHPAKRGERRRNQEKVVRGGGGLRGRAATAAAKAAGETGDDATPEKLTEKRKPGRPRRNAPATVKDVESENDEATPKRGGRSKGTPAPAESKKRGRPNGGGRGTTKTVTSRRLNNTAESVDHIDDKAFKGFDYRMDGLDEYTPERCAELENHYWKSLGFNQPMYAADMPGSLFDDDQEVWNVAKLENILDVLGTKVPGVNTAYLYLGMWKATFAWHLEDVDLYSINYIHFGAPKQWYSISQEDARRFEKAMKQAWPVDSKSCDQFLRHKTYLISPDVLQKQYGVKVNKLVHYEGEFVITYPYGYHSGYNIGYNCAESVNFATESWLEYGRIAKKCHCEDDNVWVDVAEIERKLRGEPTPEYYEETDDESELEDEDSKLPTPPASVKGKPASKKRKRDTKQEVQKKKKKIRIRIKAPSAEPCAMCPNENPWESLLPTDNGKKAHRSCALYTPETFITSEDGKELSRGIASIDRARLDLKCNYCRSKRGACFQCSGKKCARAFHATCALAAGVLIDAGPVPTFDEEGKEYYEEGFDFRCKMHRPKIPKSTTSSSLEKEERVLEYAKTLKPNDVVQVQLIGREVFAGLVVENRPAELTTVVDVLFDGYGAHVSFLQRTFTDHICSERTEVEWKYICVLDPDQSQRPKPSPNAVPMPEGMNKQLVSASNRQDGVPNQDDLFTDDPNFKWQEFYNSDCPPGNYRINRDKLPKVHVDLDKADQLYYYLPGKSTEAKCYFTDRVGGTEHVPRSNFLDRVAPPKPTYSYQTQRPSLAAAQPAPRSQPPYNAPSHYQQAHDKPYSYKPRQSIQPNMPAVGKQALPGQGRFAVQNGHHSPYSSAPYGHMVSPSPYAQGAGQIAEPSRSGSNSGAATPLRPFSQDHYYSTRVLPAAWQGEYSSFQREVRKSHGAQTLPRPDFQYEHEQNGKQESLPPIYKTTSQQNPEIRQSAGQVGNELRDHSVGHPQAPAAPADRRPSGPATQQSGPPPQGPVSNGPSPAAQCQQPPSGAPPTPTTIRPAGSAQQQQTPSAHEPASMRTPSVSMSSGSNGDRSRPASQQWTPPSQRPGATPTYIHPPYALPPPRQEEQKPKWPAAVHQTPQEFQHQLTYAPSVASRDGAHLRMMRDKGYMQPVYQHAPAQAPYQTLHHPPIHQHLPPAQHQPQQHLLQQHPMHNGAGQPFGAPGPDTHVWTSPKAPTASPISESNTPGMHRHQHDQRQQRDGYQTLAPAPAFNAAWAPQQPKPELAPLTAHAQAQNGNGQGPMLPQMHPHPAPNGGPDAWRHAN
ncbi:hypothetical protein Q7P37_010634 [Cladosporium fusiforme]